MPFFTLFIQPLIHLLHLHLRWWDLLYVILQVRGSHLAGAIPADVQCGFEKTGCSYCQPQIG